MTKKTLQLIYNGLEKLDQELPTKVSFDPNSGLISFTQRSNSIYLNPVRGLMDVCYHDCILLPNDLRDLMQSIKYLIEYEDDALFSPVKMGYNVYVRDNKYLDKPNRLIELRFYSIRNRVLIKLAKLFNNRIKHLMKL